MIVNGAYRNNKKSPPDGAVIAQSGGDLHVLFRTEREGYSHFIRDCEVSLTKLMLRRTFRVLIPLQGSLFNTEREGFEPSHRLHSLTP